MYKYNPFAGTDITSAYQSDYVMSFSHGSTQPNLYTGQAKKKKKKKKNKKRNLSQED
jgi:hypothetical protein